MAVTGTKWLGKLARLTLELESKWRCHSDLRGSVDDATQNGLTVTGESALLEELQALLTQAADALTAIQAGENGPGAGFQEQLSAIEAITEDVRWEVAADAQEQIRTRLAESERVRTEQLERAGQYEIEILELQKAIDTLGEVLLTADRRYAPVSEEKARFDQLNALVKQADRALRDRQYDTAAETIQKLKDSELSKADLLAGIAKKQEDNWPLARQADLLLLCTEPASQREDPASQRYEYTLLLRTPREPGMPGLDIQDESTMVKEDHDYLTKALEDITCQINNGLVRSFNAQDAPPAVAAAAGAAPANPDGAAAGDAAGEPVLEAAVGPAAPAPAGAGGIVALVGAGGDDSNKVPPGDTAAADALRLRMVNAPPATVTVPATQLVEDIGDLMYRLVVPETMQRFLTETKSSLIIRTNDVELPWELMRLQLPNGQLEYLCLDRPVARMPTGRAFPRRETTKDRGGNALRFLLIYSDPDENARLKAAGREVERIRDALKNRVQTIDMLSPQEITGQKLNRILRDGNYDVIHYAGHAAFDDKKPDLSGLLLWQKEVFFAQKVRRLLEGRPLVFVNACESGRTANEDVAQQLERSLQRPAEGIISSFIYGGAASCIGSVWPVYDHSAAEFAITFYTHVIEGYMVGEALRQARLKSKETYPNQITWASFVLYGDPTARLAT